MKTLINQVSFEESIKGSRFYSELFPCQSQAQAKEIIKEQKEKYSDSTHVVHAFIIGKNCEIMGMSDDGEPSGTAGRPVLDVLKGYQCTNILITITRWFGGTLLGTGGLVKAYGGGAKKVLEKADSENAFEELIEKKAFSFCTEYNLYKLIKNLFSDFQIYGLKESFESQISISGEIAVNSFDEFAEKIKNLSNGKILL